MGGWAGVFEHTPLVVGSMLAAVMREGRRLRCLWDPTPTAPSSHSARVHLDPCEDACDKPLLYEAGWGKKLSYVLAVGRHGAADATRRYTQRWADVCQRWVGGGGGVGRGVRVHGKEGTVAQCCRATPACTPPRLPALPHAGTKRSPSHTLVSLAAGGS